jgi:hypothetical protein
MQEGTLTRVKFDPIYPILTHNGITLTQAVRLTLFAEMQESFRGAPDCVRAAVFATKAPKKKTAPSIYQVGFAAEQDERSHSNANHACKQGR